MKSCIIILSIMAAALLTSCRSTPPPRPKPIPPVSEQMKQHAQQLAKILAPCQLRAVFIDKATVDLYEEAPEKLLRHLQFLGITHVCLDIPVAWLAGKNHANSVAKLIGKLQDAKIKISLLIDDIQFYRIHNLDWGDRNIRITAPVSAINKTVNTIKRFNAARDSASERINRILLFIAPHRINSKMTRPPRGMLWSWNPDGFGKGNDNDMLMRQAFEIIKQFKQAAAPLNLSLIISPYYHEYAVKGKLSLGRVDDFLLFSKHLIMVAYSVNPNLLISRVQRELAAAKRPHSLTVAVLVGRRIFGAHNEKLSFSTKKWDFFIQHMKKLIDACAKYKSFNGIIIYSLGGLEKTLDR